MRAPSRSPADESEAQIQARILLSVGGERTCRLFRNPVGEGWVGQTVRREGPNVLLTAAQRVTYGLSVGSPDTVGWRSVVVTPAMVGQTVAVFVGIEVKDRKGVASDEQKNFLAVLRAGGGLAGLARTVGEARAIALLAPL